MKNQPDENMDCWFNEEGLLVMSAKYLSARGYCCGNACLHCPYSYEAVTEPRRSELLMEQKEKIKHK